MRGMPTPISAAAHGGMNVCESKESPSGNCRPLRAIDQRSHSFLCHFLLMGILCDPRRRIRKLEPIFLSGTSMVPGTRTPGESVTKPKQSVTPSKGDNVGRYAGL